MTTRTLLVLCVALTLSGCDKSGSGSGAPSASDAELMKSLPATSNIVFGGDFIKAQQMLASFGKLADVAGKGMKGYVECFAQAKGLHIAGGMSLASGKPDMRVVMSGIDVPTIEGCATTAGFKVTKDADGKFINIEIPGVVGSIQQSYLVLASGALYSQQQLGMRHGAPLDRQALEAEATSAGKANVAADPKLQALIAKADKSKMLWFAGTAAGTPMGTKIGEVMGTLDVSPDIAVSLDLQITDEALATRLDGYVSQAKMFAGNASSDLKAVVDTLDYKKDGDRLHFGIKITQEQLQGLMKTLGGLIGMGAR